MRFRGVLQIVDISVIITIKLRQISLMSLIVYRILSAAVPKSENDKIWSEPSRIFET